MNVENGSESKSNQRGVGCDAGPTPSRVPGPCLRLRHHFTPQVQEKTQMDILEKGRLQLAY